MRAAKRKRPRRRPAKERSRVLCAAIEEAAAHVLARQGYDGASTGAIADRAGVSIGSVYQYFADKDAVFDALAARILDRLVEAMRPAVALDGTPFEARVERVLLAAIEVLAPYPTVFRQLAAVRGTRFASRLRDARRRAFEAARVMLELHREALTVTELALAARLLIDVGEGVLLNLDAHEAPRRLAREAARLVVRYCTG